MQGGKLRLVLLDHAGWYVSDALNVEETDRDGDEDEDAMDESQDDSGSGNAAAELKYLKQLIQGLEHSLLLENGTGGFMLLVPNHDLYRLPLAGDPFPTNIMADRASMGWQTTMDTRYYLYPVHQSHVRVCVCVCVCVFAQHPAS